MPPRLVDIHSGSSNESSDGEVIFLASASARWGPLLVPFPDVITFHQGSPTMCR